MDPRADERLRDRAIWFVRIATAAGVTAAVGLTWLFSNAAEAYFSGRPPTPVVPRIPASPTPVQQPRPVVTQVVHGPAPRPPSQRPGSAPAPPPPPACVSTPSHPC